MEDPMEWTGGNVCFAEKILPFSKLEIEPLTGKGDEKLWSLGQASTLLSCAVWLSASPIFVCLAVCHFSV